MILGFQYHFWLGIFLLFVLGLLGLCGRRSFFLFLSLFFLYLLGCFGRFPALPLIFQLSFVNRRKDGTRQRNIAERRRKTRRACHASDDSTRTKTRRRVTLF